MLHDAGRHFKGEAMDIMMKILTVVTPDSVLGMEGKDVIQYIQNLLTNDDGILNDFLNTLHKLQVVMPMDARHVYRHRAAKRGADPTTADESTMSDNIGFTNMKKTIVHRKVGMTPTVKHVTIMENVVTTYAIFASGTGADISKFVSLAKVLSKTGIVTLFVPPILRNAPTILNLQCNNVEVTTTGSAVQDFTNFVDGGRIKILSGALHLMKTLINKQNDEHKPSHLSKSQFKAVFSMPFDGMAACTAQIHGATWVQICTSTAQTEGLLPIYQQITNNLTKIPGVSLNTDEVPIRTLKIVGENLAMYGDYSGIMGNYQFNTEITSDGMSDLMYDLLYVSKASDVATQLDNYFELMAGKTSTNSLIVMGDVPESALSALARNGRPHLVQSNYLVRPETVAIEYVYSHTSPGMIMYTRALSAELIAIGSTIEQLPSELINIPMTMEEKMLMAAVSTIYLTQVGNNWHINTQDWSCQPIDKLDVTNSTIVLNGVQIGYKVEDIHNMDCVSSTYIQADLLEQQLIATACTCTQYGFYHHHQITAVHAADEGVAVMAPLKSSDSDDLDANVTSSSKGKATMIDDVVTEEPQLNVAITSSQMKISDIQVVPPKNLSSKLHPHWLAKCLGVNDDPSLQEKYHYVAEVKCLLIEEVYDPKGTDNQCVIECFVRHLRLANWQKELMISKFMVSPKGLTVSDIISLAFALNVNMILVDEELDGRVFRCNHTLPDMCVRLCYNHCELVRLKIIETEEVPYSEDQSIEMFAERCEEHGDTYYPTVVAEYDKHAHDVVARRHYVQFVTLLNTWNADTLNTMLKEVEQPWRNMLADRGKNAWIRATNQNLHHRINISRMAVSHNVINSDTNESIMNMMDPCNCRNGSILLVSGGNEQCLVMVVSIASGNKTLRVITPYKLPPVCVAINIETSLYNPLRTIKATVDVVDLTNRYYILANKDTKQYLDTIGEDTTGLEIGGVCPNLIITSFDNELHHRDDGVHRLLLEEATVPYKNVREPYSDDLAPYIKKMPLTGLCLVNSNLMLKQTLVELGPNKKLLDIMQPLMLNCRVPIDRLMAVHHELSENLGNRVKWREVPLTAMRITPYVAKMLGEAVLRKSEGTACKIDQIEIEGNEASKMVKLVAAETHSRLVDSIGGSLLLSMAAKAKLEQIHSFYEWDIIISQTNDRLDGFSLLTLDWTKFECLVIHSPINVKRDGLAVELTDNSYNERFMLRLVFTNVSRSDMTEKIDILLRGKLIVAGKNWLELPDHDPEINEALEPEDRDLWAIGRVKKLVVSRRAVGVVLNSADKYKVLATGSNFFKDLDDISHLQSYKTRISEHWYLNMKGTKTMTRRLSEPTIHVTNDPLVLSTLGVANVTNQLKLDQDLRKQAKIILSENSSQQEKLIKNIDFGALDALQTWNMQTILTWTDNPDSYDAVSRQYRPKFALDYISTIAGMASVDPDVTAHVMHAWEDNDWTEQHNRVAPKSKFRVTDHSELTAYKKFKKATMVRYPLISRPVFTAQVDSLFNAFSQRIAAAQELREYNIDPRLEVNRIIKVYFIPEANTIASDYRGSPVGIDGAACREWLKERPGIQGIANEVDKILDEGLLVHKLNQLKMHGKLESLFKLIDRETMRKEPRTLTLRHERTRLIVWQAKGICMLFAPMFLKIKERLKSLLNEKIIYADGYTPSELNKTMVNISNQCTVIESDLEKQDRQTDDQDLDVEFALYSYLGAHEIALSMWRTIHKSWKMKGDTLRAFGNAMRMTGQATTALGNVIVNMMVHSRFVERNYSRIERLYMLGDDFAGFIKDDVNLSKLRNEIAKYYNMRTKAFSHADGGTFLQMIIHKTPEGHYALGPNYTRLRNKFEVTNGVSDATAENIQARRMSYLMMLGDSPETRAIIQENDLPITPEAWYTDHLVVKTIAKIHKMSEETVMNDKQLLLKYLRTGPVYEHEFDMGIQSKW
jgi:hypothetical protein